MGWPNGTPAKAPFLLASWDVMLSTARHSEKSSREEKASNRVTLPECRHCLPGITRAWLGIAPAFFSSQKTESWPERGSPGVTDGAHHNQQDICCQHRRQHLVQRVIRMIVREAVYGGKEFTQVHESRPIPSVNTMRSKATSLTVWAGAGIICLLSAFLLLYVNQAPYGPTGFAHSRRDVGPIHAVTHQNPAKAPPQPLSEALRQVSSDLTSAHFLKARELHSFGKRDALRCDDAPCVDGSCCGKNSTCGYGT